MSIDIVLFAMLSLVALSGLIKFSGIFWFICSVAFLIYFWMFLGGIGVLG